MTADFVGVGFLTITGCRSDDDDEKVREPKTKTRMSKSEDAMRDSPQVENPSR